MHFATFCNLIGLSVIVMACTTILGTLLITWSLRRFLRTAFQSAGYRKGLYGLKFETAIQNRRFYMILHTLFQKNDGKYIEKQKLP